LTAGRDRTHEHAITDPVTRDPGTQFGDHADRFVSESIRMSFTP
jgi:hypothetical protein